MASVTMEFTSLGFSTWAAGAAVASGFREPTEVQRATASPVLAGRDALAQARTGSGKTAAFGLAVLDRLAVDRVGGNSGPSCLVVVPTRELAAQVADVMDKWSRHWPEPSVVAAIFGGVGLNPQFEALRRRCDVVVATPGRLLDHVDRGALRLDGVRILVLDEADRLLQLGFKDELDRIISLLPQNRQSLFFSATFPDAVRRLAEALLRDPAQVGDASESDAPITIEQRAIRISANERGALLRSLLEKEGWRQTIVFVGTKRRAGNLARKLGERGWACGCIHGDLSQSERSAALDAFKRGQSRVLIATDVAGRGIDVERLDCVVNFDLPRSTQDYGHRIGRTGRAGRQGVAVSFVTPEEEAHFNLIRKRHRLTVELETAEGFAEPLAEQPRSVGAPPVKGKRKSKKDKLRELAARESDQQKTTLKKIEPNQDSGPPSPWDEAVRRKRSD